MDERMGQTGGARTQKTRGAGSLRRAMKQLHDLGLADESDVEDFGPEEDEEDERGGRRLN